VTRQRDSAFARIVCAPLADVEGGRHVLVLKPLSPLVPPPASPRPRAGKPQAPAASGVTRTLPR